MTAPAAPEVPLHPAALDDPGSAASLNELLQLARLRMAPAAFDYVELGAGAEVTVQRNRQAFGQWDFRQRLLAGAEPPDLAVTVGSLQASLPVITAPFGNDTFMHPDGHAAVARAVHRAGTYMVAPHGSGVPMEQISEASQGSVAMFQAGLGESDRQVLEMIERAAAAGYPYVLFTHMPIGAWRERLAEHRADLTVHRSGNVAGSPTHPAPAVREPWDWERFERVARQSALPWFLKGVQEPEDARRAIDCGAAGIYVSNFGGRNLDSVPASITRLAVVADEVAGAVPIVFDSGIRRGSDVVKALALGADLVAVGRLAAFALGAGGEPAVHRMLELLRQEITAVLAELGVSSPTELNRSHLLPASDWAGVALQPRNRETLPLLG